MKLSRFAALAALTLLGLAGGAWADDAAIRRNLAERLPRLGKIDEIGKTQIPGIFEIRIGSEVYYTDANGDYLMQGSLIETRSKRNLTEERQEKLQQVAFDQLPLQDAFTIVRGDGKRKLAVFEDPNCGYCKLFERDLQKVNNVTVYMFLYPILGPDSEVKSAHHWCAKDRGRAWLNWMVRDQRPPAADCDTSALTRNVEFGRRYGINSTPTMIFADGTRVPGALRATDMEKLLAQIKQ
ncbi:DsbC family protein [Caenimonas aquaedulcis]|uniref:Thiol:disulfide interchange protein n=1 Tax=Caenimonas aquaedulcis TaxID=2793270 RepID=A0A931H6Q4_9BURK|nr:DsbC family protein [Caenimonas aquaedulcis]MBG9389472.1 DsbC family protein [Caenimonas aquaedulcis]